MMVSNDTTNGEMNLPEETISRIEREIEVRFYIQDLKYALNNGTDDVYIKIRVELLGTYGNTTTFVMSFHFAEKKFAPEMFPYKR